MEIYKLIFKLSRNEPFVSSKLEIQVDFEGEKLTTYSKKYYQDCFISTPDTPDSVFIARQIAGAKRARIAAEWWDKLPDFEGSYDDIMAEIDKRFGEFDYKCRP